jgi:glutamate-1-semialdehyde aminotransferase
MKGGIPEKLYEDVFEFHYNDLDMLEDLMKKHGDETSAIIMTPFGHPLHQKMQEPKPGFLEGVRKLADKYGSVLIFDEVRTCFRLKMGGAQELYGVKPDLTVLGKGMANGWAISVVTGKKDVMMAASSKIFISSTFFPNSEGYVAALKTIEVMEREKVIDNIWEKGNRLMAKIQGIIDKYPNTGAELTGVAPMFMITFTKAEPKMIRDLRTEFYTQLIRKGFFFTPHHHAYICFRHTEEDLNLTAAAIDESMAYISEKFKG